MVLQTLVEGLYPAQCLLCETRIAAGQEGLCPDCRKDTPFLMGARCETCAQPLAGVQDCAVQCDRCLSLPPNWSRGRSAIVYAGRARSLVMGFKHGDRSELTPLLSDWMLKAGRDIVTQESVLVPVPLHWSRRLKRRYNQSALLSKQIAKKSGAVYAPDTLRRKRATPSLDRRGRDERRKVLRGAITASTRADVRGRSCIIVDDVYTTGETAAACTEALLQVGAYHVDVLTLARVASWH